MPKYLVSITQVLRVERETSYEIEAIDQEDAEEQASAMDDPTDGWEMTREELMGWSCGAMPFSRKVA